MMMMMMIKFGVFCYDHEDDEDDEEDVNDDDDDFRSILLNPEYFATEDLA